MSATPTPRLSQITSFDTGVGRQKGVRLKLNKIARNGRDHTASVLNWFSRGSCGILALQFHKVPRFLFQYSPPENSVWKEQIRGGSNWERLAGCLRRRPATCIDGAAHPGGAGLQLCSDLLPFARPASCQVCLSPIRRDSYPRDSSRGTHEPIFSSGLRWPRSRDPAIPSGNSPLIFPPPHSARDSDRRSRSVRYSEIAGPRRLLPRTSGLDPGWGSEVRCLREKPLATAARSKGW